MAQLAASRRRRSLALVAIYSGLAVLAAFTSVGLWLLMVVDEGMSVWSATVEMAVKFTNLTVVLVAVVAAWIASGRSPVPARTVTHLTVMLMAVVTAIVNATLLDPSLPGGWWGLVDLFQHYVIPAAVVALWATRGPPVVIPWSRLWLVLLVPIGWLTLVLVRGAVNDSYPYDFIDVAANGWVNVLTTVTLIVAFMLGLGAGIATIDRRWHRTRRR